MTNGLGETLLYVRSMGKLLKVTAITPDAKTANEWMEKHDDDALMAELPDGTCLMGNRYDKGQKVSFTE